MSRARKGLKTPVKKKRHIKRPPARIAQRGNGETRITLTADDEAYIRQLFGITGEIREVVASDNCFD